MFCFFCKFPEDPQNLTKLHIFPNFAQFVTFYRCFHTQIHTENGVLFTSEGACIPFAFEWHENLLQHHFFFFLPPILISHLK